jgi:hypothetical protein
VLKIATPPKLLLEEFVDCNIEDFMKNSRDSFMAKGEEKTIKSSAF